MIALQGLRDYRLSQTLNGTGAKPLLNMLRSMLVILLGFSAFLAANWVDDNYDATLAGAKFIYLGSVRKDPSNLQSYSSISATVYSTRSNVKITKTWLKQLNGSFDAPGWATGDAAVGSEIPSALVSGVGSPNYAVQYHELLTDPWYVRHERLLITSLSLIGVSMFIFAFYCNISVRIET